MLLSVWIQIVSGGEVYKGNFVLEMTKPLTLKKVIKKIGKAKTIKLEKKLLHEKTITILLNQHVVDYPKDSDFLLKGGDTLDIIQHIMGG